MRQAGKQPSNHRPGTLWRGASSSGSHLKRRPRGLSHCRASLLILISLGKGPRPSVGSAIERKRSITTKQMSKRRSGRALTRRAPSPPPPPLRAHKHTLQHERGRHHPSQVHQRRSRRRARHRLRPGHRSLCRQLPCAVLRQGLVPRLASRPPPPLGAATTTTTETGSKCPAADGGGMRQGRVRRGPGLGLCSLGSSAARDMLMDARARAGGM